MGQTLYESCRYTFTADELRDLGAKLAQENQDAIELNEMKASVMADFAARLKASAKRIAEYSQKVTSRYEMRDMECVVMLDTPRPGLKTIVRVDTGEERRTEGMTEDERQGALFPERAS
jgi:hypothetical protein